MCGRWRRPVSALPDSPIRSRFRTGNGPVVALATPGHLPKPDGSPFRNPKVGRILIVWRRVGLRRWIVSRRRIIVSRGRRVVVGGGRSVVVGGGRRVVVGGVAVVVVAPLCVMLGAS